MKLMETASDVLVAQKGAAIKDPCRSTEEKEQRPRNDFIQENEWRRSKDTPKTTLEWACLLISSFQQLESSLNLWGDTLNSQLIAMTLKLVWICITAILYTSINPHPLHVIVSKKACLKARSADLENPTFNPQSTELATVRTCTQFAHVQTPSCCLAYSSCTQAFKKVFPEITLNPACTETYNTHLTHFALSSAFIFKGDLKQGKPSYLNHNIVFVLGKGKVHFVCLPSRGWEVAPETFPFLHNC